MSDNLKIVTVPRDLYYHEVAYVRGLQADNERLRAALQDIAENSYAADGRAAEIARRALEPKP